MQILVFVVMAVIYGLASIFKAKSNKLEKQKEEQLGRKPGFKPPEGRARAVPARPKTFQKTPFQQAQRPAGRTVQRQPQPQIQPPRRKVMRPQPIGQRLAAKIERAFQLPTMKPVEAPELSLPRSQIKPEFKEVPEIAVRPFEKLEDKYVGVPEETSGPKYLSEILLDYADPDELRMAILHYEILGKPLSLRNPSEQR